MNEADPLLRKSTLLAHHKDGEALLAQSDSFVKMSGVPLQCALFASQEDAVQLFRKSQVAGFRIQTHHSSSSVLVGKLTHEYGRKSRRVVEGEFLLLALPSAQGAYLVITDQGGDFAREGVERLLCKAYPSVARPFFHTAEMQEMLDVLQRATPRGRIMLTQVSRKSRIKSQAARKQRESDVKWTDLPYEEVFKETIRQDSWMAAVSFDIVTELKTERGSRTVETLSGYASRAGIFRCGKDFRTFYDCVIATAAKKLLVRQSTLKDRARTQHTGYRARPMCIEFDEPVLRDKSQLSRLVSVLTAMPNTDYSVMHGNPYVHITMTDSLDGSNYEIWVLSDWRIVVTPQTVCSTSSLSRLCDHISREFEEGAERDLSEATSHD